MEKLRKSIKIAASHFGSLLDLRGNIHSRSLEFDIAGGRDKTLSLPHRYADGLAGVGLGAKPNSVKPTFCVCLSPDGGKKFKEGPKEMERDEDRMRKSFSRITPSPLPLFLGAKC